MAECPWPRVWPSATVVLAVVLAACGQQPQLPPPGLEGGVLQLWREAEAQPVVVHIERARQAGTQPGSLHLDGVTVELPLDAGSLWLRSRSGRSLVGGDPSLVLDGPVRISGWRDGLPLVGVAAEARLAGPEQDLVLDDLRLIHAGHRRRYGALRWRELWTAAGPSPDGRAVVGSPAPALWAAGLGATAAAVPAEGKQ